MESNIWVLGSHYVGKLLVCSSIHFVCSLDRESYLIIGSKRTEQLKLHRHLSSLLRMTYRKDFPALTPYHYTDDAGWGCMLRSAQSMMAHTLLRHFLGDGRDT